MDPGGRRRHGLGTVRLVALTDDGRMTYDPDAAAVEAMLAGLRERQYVVLQRLTDHDEGDCYLQVLLSEAAIYEVEHRAGVAGECQWT